MHLFKHLSATGACPLSRSRKTDRLAEEDAFMKLHGGKGASLIYRVVCQIEDAGTAVFSLLRGSRTANTAKQGLDSDLAGNCAMHPAPPQSAPGRVNCISDATGVAR